MDREFYDVITSALALDTELEKTAALEEKSFNALDVIECIKEAGLGSALATGAKGVGKGLLYGAGAAVPVGLAGKYLVDHTAKAKEEATKNVIEDVRNKALQTALAVGGVGAGLLGMHHMLSKQRAQNAATQDAVPTEEWQGLYPQNYAKMGAEAQKPNLGMPPGAPDANLPLQPQKPAMPKPMPNRGAQTMETKFSSVEADLITKFATVGYIDSVLEPLEKNADAQEMRLLNAEYGVNILKELLG